MEDGRVTAISAGLATITVTSNQNPKMKATCEVAVGPDTAFSSSSQAVAKYDFEELTQTTEGTVTLEDVDRNGATGESLKLGSENASVKLDNPYAGMEELKAEPTYDSDGYPVWTTGVTMSYWMKTVDETASTMLTFKNDKYLSVQKDDVGKYMVCQKFAELYGTETDGEITYEEVTDTSSDFYLGTKSYYTANADGTGTVYTVYKDYGQYMEYSPHYEGNGYAVDETAGTITAYNSVTGEEVKLKSIGSAGNEMGYWTRYSKLYDEAGGDDQTSVVRYGYTQGFLEISSINQFAFAQQVCNAKQMNPLHTGSYGTEIALQSENQLAFTPTEKATTATLSWHYVTVVIKNDDVLFYVDGKKQSYPSITYNKKNGIWGNNTCSTAFNRGYRMGSEYDTVRNPYSNSYLTSTYSADSRRYAATILEWLTDENTELMLGGNLVIATGGCDGLFPGWNRGYKQDKCSCRNAD